MTLENYQYRTSPLFLRNQFLGYGRWNIPVIPKAEFDDADFRDLLLIGFDRTKLEDDKNRERMVHFFLYDYAVRVRHFTDHSCPGGVHTNPHDHKIDWSHNFPHWTEQINYQGEAPKFKCFKEVNMIKKGKTIIVRPEDVRFTSIGDFKWSMHCGGEIQFEWKAKTYAIFAKQHKTPSAPEQILFTQTAIENQEGTFRWFDTADDVLELVIDGDRLRDIITEIEVFERNI